MSCGDNRETHELHDDMGKKEISRACTEMAEMPQKRTFALLLYEGQTSLNLCL
jgi:hypothetical protein